MKNEDTEQEQPEKLVKPYVSPEVKSAKRGEPIPYQRFKTTDQDVIDN